MIANRPAILVCIRDADPAVLSEVLAGMEEEGVLWSVSEEEDRDAAFLAKKGADASAVGCGIGIYGTNLCLQMRGVPYEKPVESVREPSREDCRRVGANAARAVCRKPFR